MADAGLQGEMGPQPDGVLEIPGSVETAPSKFVGGGHHLKCGDGSLQEGGQIGKAGHAELARRGVFIVAEPLEPDSGADLMNTPGDLHAVGNREKVAAIPDSGGVVGACGSDGAVAAGGGDAAVDHYASGRRAVHK